MGSLWIVAEGSGLVPHTGDFIRVTESGEITDRITLPSGVSVACVLGGIDGRTLYMLSADRLVLQRSWSEASQSYVPHPNRPADSGSIHAVHVRFAAA